MSDVKKNCIHWYKSSSSCFTRDSCTWIEAWAFSFMQGRRGTWPGILLTQVHMPKVQWGQTNGEVEVWSREMFLAGLWKEVGGSGPPKISKIPKGFQQSFFKDQVLEMGHRLCDQLLDSSLIGWLWGNRAVSQVLTLSVLRLRETWG